jgi:hypothetical protein
VRISKLTAALLSVSALAAPSLAQFPSLELLQPRGFQRGCEIELQLSGNALNSARGILFDTEGLSLKEITTEGDRVTAHVIVADDCPLGLHSLRVRTATGLSNLRTFSVGALEEVFEEEPNGTSPEAQPIKINSTINGVADDEDLDLYAFEGVSGQRVSVEIEGLRLGDTLFDSAIALFDPDGFRIASSDDSSLGRQDGVFSVVLNKSGRHLVHVRESSYKGNGNCRYRLHVGSFPRPIFAVPAGGPEGEPLTLSALGDGAGVMEATVTLSTARSAWGPTLPGVSAVHIEDSQGISPTPIFLRASSLTNVLSAEPDESHDLATRFNAPAALNGVLESPGDRDSFRFTAKKGERWELKVHARSLRSPLDSVLSIYAANAAQISSNDDDVGPDSKLDFTAPADGDYVLTIADHLGSGGPTHAYRLEVDHSRPSLSVGLGGVRKYVCVPRAGRSVIAIQVERDSFSGEIAIALGDLPPGVTATALPVRAGTSNVPLLFEAEATAEEAEALIKVSGVGAGGVSSELRDEVLLVEGRNNQIYWTHTLDRLPLAVTEVAPFSVRAIAPEVPLLQNGLLSVEIVAERSEGYNDAISLALVSLPPGVTATRGASIPEGALSTLIHFDASSDAALGSWPLVIAAEANIPGGRARLATQIFELVIERPFVSFKTQAVSVDQGSTGDMFVEVTRHDGFRGTARVNLLGLPHQVTTPALTLDANTDSLIFPISAGTEAPTGRHRTLSFNATFTLDGGTLIQGLSAAELHVNTPPKVVIEKKPVPVVKKEEPKSPEVKKERPPTRLEKLRREHAERVRARETADAPPTNGGAS